MSMLMSPSLAILRARYEICNTVPKHFFGVLRSGKIIRHFKFLGFQFLMSFLSVTIDDMLWDNVLTHAPKFVLFAPMAQGHEAEGRLIRRFGG